MGKGATQTCIKPTSGNNLSFLIRARLLGRTPAQTTRPNELRWMPSSNPPERFYMGARMTKMKRKGRARQTSYTNVHKANLRSQLSIFDTGSFPWARPHPNDPLERVDMDGLKRPAHMTETKRQGRAKKTSCTNMHKANLGSQLNIFDIGSFTRVRPHPNELRQTPSNDLPE